MLDMCVYVSVHVPVSILAWRAGGCRSQIPLLFLGAVSAQLSRSLSVCQKESATLPVSCPQPHDTVCPNPCPYLNNLLTPPPRPHCSLAVGIPGTRSPPASAVSTALAGLGSCSGRGLGEGGDQGRGCSLCYFELLTGAAERGDSLLWAAPDQAMRVSVLLTPNPGNAPGSP